MTRLSVLGSWKPRKKYPEAIRDEPENENPN